MKDKQILFFLATAIASFLVSSCNPGDDMVLQFTNPLDQSRENAAILLTSDEISGFTEIPADKLPFLIDGSGNAVPCQADDVDGDGRWDELFALMDLEPSEQKKITLGFIDPAGYPEFEARTNLRLGAADRQGYPELLTAQRLEGVSYHNYGGVTGAAYQMEGPAWENDRVGFRNYLDQRNGMDIFGKLVPQMVLDSVGIAGSPSYHEPAEWGMDILKVGTSLGSGAIGYLYNDSIYRVGDNGSGSYRVIFEGSQRSRFDLLYEEWKVDELSLEVSHQIDITGGRHYFQGSVTYTGTDRQLSLVPGIVNMKSDQMHVVEVDPNHTALITHDAQSEDGSMLAMALMVPTANLVSTGEAPEDGDGITQTYYTVLGASAGDAATYRFYALWEKEDPRWASLESVTEYLRSEAERWTQSVVIKALR